MVRHQIHKRALSLFLSFAMVFGIFGMDTAGAFAAQDSGIKNSGLGAMLLSTNNPNWLSLDNGSIVITDSGYFVGGGTKQNTPVGGYFITQSNDTTPNTISVTGSGICTQDITIQSVNVNVSGTPNACAFAIAKGARVNLTLEGQNMLKSGQNCAGLEVYGDSSAPEDPAKNASLTITADSTGMLTATGGEYGAGIGGNKNGTCGSITINGGTITATASGGGGAGIGGGGYGGGNNIMINGGMVTAIGRAGGAGIGGGSYGIGGGSYGTGGTVTVTGGIIMATGSGYGAGIGAGDSSSGGTIKINGGIVTTIGGDNGGAGIGGGYGGASGTVTISGMDTQVTAKGQGGEDDIGSDYSGNSGGSLAVSGGATVALLGSGTTNASAPIGVPMYANCQIITGSTEKKYSSGGGGTSVTLLTSTLTAKPAAGGAMELTASVSPAEAGTFTFAYCGAKDSGIIIRDVPIVNGAASTTWTNPPVHGLTVITAKYKASGYDALKATYNYNPDGAIDLSTVSADGYGYTYDGTGHIITLMNSGTYTFTGSTRGTTANKIVVQTGVSADVTLCDANIDASTHDACPFSIAANASVNLTLTGTNTLQSGTTYAALGVPAGACLTVTEQSSGTLDAAAVHSNSTTLGAGIGGCGHGTGTIIINGGRITANGSNNNNGFGAGIGGGADLSGAGDAGGSITINGGTVTATSCYGAGIGGGGSTYTGGAGGGITINGGTVTATSCYGAGIGGGQGNVTGGAGGTVIINGGKITADGSNGSNAGVSAGIGGGYGGSTGGAGGNVTVNGGFLIAKHGSNSRDIGGGTSGSVGILTGGGPVGADGINAFQGGSVAAGSVSPQPVGSTGSSTKVYKTSAQIPGVSAETPAACTANGHGFLTQTDAQGFLYVWLPESAAASYSIRNENTAISYLAKGMVNPAASVNPLSVFCTDTGLTGLTVRGQPAVFNGTDTYSCSFGNSVAALAKSDFVPAFHGTGDTWQLCGDSSGTQELSSLNLNAGENTAFLKVTAQDGTTVKIYKLNLTRAAAPQHNSGGSSHGSTAPSLPTSLTDSPTNTTVDLSSATFPAGVTGISLAVTPEAANGAPSAPGNTGNSSDPQGAEVYHLVISQTNLNLIGSPFVYNIKLLDQNGNPITSFTGSVTVKVAIPAGIHGTPHIFRYEESTKTFTDLGATVENGFLVFKTTHFSYYVIAGTGDSVTLDTKSYQMPVGGSYQIGIRLTGSKATAVKVHSTNDKAAAVIKLESGNYQVVGIGIGRAWIMFDVYDNKNHLLTHASVKVDVKTGIRPRGDSTRQIGIF